MKYKLTEETKCVAGITLYRIQALINIPSHSVKAGDLGGWVQSENNLSQDDTAWVSGNAQVYDNALVYDDAQVYGNARVYGEAQVYGEARVSDNACVYDNARVYDNAWVCGNARVSGATYAYDNAYVSVEEFEDAHGNVDNAVTDERKLEAWTNAVIAGDTTLGLAAWLTENYRVHAIRVIRSVTYERTFVVEAACRVDAEEDALRLARNHDYTEHLPSGAEYTIDSTL